MSDNDKGFKVTIVDKEFRVNCTKDAENALQEAATYLDKQMRKIRNTGRVIGLERIAVMAALNICHELLTLKSKSPEEEVKNLSDRLQVLQNKIDGALSDKPTIYDKLNFKHTLQNEFEKFETTHRSNKEILEYE
ncbi:MAG TPA: cell division protein ZapA [Gammaproteobacteria bacterium]|nr:cell division protein ZapA [Gammaproteobacteria bacterium]